MPEPAKGSTIITLPPLDRQRYGDAQADLESPLGALDELVHGDDRWGQREQREDDLPKHTDTIPIAADEYNCLRKLVERTFASRSAAIPLQLLAHGIA